MSLQLKQFELLIFDWDGTLIDSIDWIVHCLQTAAINCALPASDDTSAKNVIGLSIQHAMRSLFPEVDADTLQRLVEGYSRTYFSRQLSRADLFAGVFELLTHWQKQGYRLAVATGKTRKGLNAALTETATRDLFCVTRCADETASKPNPRMIEEILAETGIAKQNAVLIGDSIHDMAMAQQAGIAGIAVTSGANTAEELAVYQPLACVNYVTDLANW